MKKVGDVYVNAGDEKKALEIAKELLRMVEQYKVLQTYANYYVLKTIFETKVPEKTLAKACADQADKLLGAMTGAATSSAAAAGTDPQSQWNNIYFSPLFSTTDPENASKAFQFLSKNPSLQTYNNYTFVSYAFERNGDFQKAKENYEKALTLRGDDKNEFHSYLYYASFLSRSGEYLKAEEFLERMEKLSGEAVEILRTAYKSEALSSRTLYYLSIGDYAAYVQAANDSYEYFSKMSKVTDICDPYSMTRFTVTAYGKEMLKEYDEAERLWKKSDSSQYAWVTCNNKRFPQYQRAPLSILPVYLIKTGKRNALEKPTAFYVKETEDHFSSYSQYADLSINFMKAVQLGFLGAAKYHDVFKGVLGQITETRNFRESTTPFSYYAYFTRRDRRYDQSRELYDQLFKMNVGWINDVIFSFGEKAFVTYYNSKLKDGYDDYHTFVKIAKEKGLKLFPILSSQAYNNLLFTKSLSLKGTQKRKKAFLKANDPATVRLYEEWIGKKEQLIRLYRKSEDATSASAKTENSVSPEQLKKLQAEVDHLENELVTKAKDFEKYLKIAPPDWKTVRNQLKEGEAAIEMVRFQWRDQVFYSDTAYYAAYIITKTSPHPDVVYLPDTAEDLDNKFYKSYQNTIKFKVEDKDSYNRYWKSIQDQLKGINKVYFSPDGIYHLINLPTLQNPGTGKYLLDEIDIHYTTGSGETQGTNTDEIKNAVLMGRPSYKIEKGEPTLLVRADKATRSFVRNFRDNSISDLPGTEEEVMTIRKENGGACDQNKFFRP